MIYTRLFDHKTSLISIVVLLAIISGCATSNNLKIGKLTTLTDEQLEQRSSPAKLLIMPLDVELSLLTASGLTEPKAEWTQNAIDFMKDSVNRQLVAGGNTTEFYTSYLTDPENDLVQLEKLHEATGYSILWHEYAGVKLPSRKDRPGDWTLGVKAKALAAETGADYALFIFVRDSYSSGGRAALMILGAIAGVGIQGGTQIGFASLVDLKTGDIAWFNRLLSGSGDLRKQKSSDKTVQNLLKGLPNI